VLTAISFACFVEWVLLFAKEDLFSIQSSAERCATCFAKVFRRSLARPKTEMG